MWMRNSLGAQKLVLRVKEMAIVTQSTKFFYPTFVNENDSHEW